MPRSLSSKKRVRLTEKQHERNRTIKSRIRTARRTFLKAVESGDPAGAKEKFLACEKLLHRAAANGPVHRNTAARTIGRLQARLVAMQKPAAPAAK
jgi:small subunit ribosomal protein S20